MRLPESTPEASSSWFWMDCPNQPLIENKANGGTVECVNKKSIDTKGRLLLLTKSSRNDNSKWVLSTTWLVHCKLVVCEWNHDFNFIRFQIVHLKLDKFHWYVYSVVQFIPFIFISKISIDVDNTVLISILYIGILLINQSYVNYHFSEMNFKLKLHVGTFDQTFASMPMGKLFSAHQSKLTDDL